MVNCLESLKNVDYTKLSLKEQAYKLVCNYVLSSRPKIYGLLRDSGNDAVDDFISYAYEYILASLKRFDSSRGNLSTFIYNTLDYLYPVFVYQAKYHVSYYTAKLMSSTTRVDEEKRKRLINMYSSGKHIDTCNDSILTAQLDSSGQDEYANIPDMALADPNAYVEEQVINAQDSYILQILETEVDKYVNRPGSKNEQAERNKDIIYRLILDKEDNTLQKIADDYGLTRERVRQIFLRFCDWAKRNNNLRTALGLGRYKPEEKF